MVDENERKILDTLSGGESIEGCQVFQIGEECSQEQLTSMFHFLGDICCIVIQCQGGRVKSAMVMSETPVKAKQQNKFCKSNVVRD